MFFMNGHTSGIASKSVFRKETFGLHSIRLWDIEEMHCNFKASMSTFVQKWWVGREMLFWRIEVGSFQAHLFDISAALMREYQYRNCSSLIKARSRPPDWLLLSEEVYIEGHEWTERKLHNYWRVLDDTVRFIDSSFSIILKSTLWNTVLFQKIRPYLSYD